MESKTTVTEVEKKLDEDGKEIEVVKKVEATGDISAVPEDAKVVSETVTTVPVEE